MPSISERCTAAYAAKLEGLAKIDRHMQELAKLFHLNIITRTALIESKNGDFDELEADNRQQCGRTAMELVLPVPAQVDRKETEALVALKGFEDLHKVCARPDIDCRIALERRYLDGRGDVRAEGLATGTGEVFIVVYLNEKYVPLKPAAAPPPASRGYDPDTSGEGPSLT